MVYYHCLLAWVVSIGICELMIWKAGDTNKDEFTLKPEIRDSQCFSKV